MAISSPWCGFLLHPTSWTLVLLAVIKTLVDISSFSYYVYSLNHVLRLYHYNVCNYDNDGNVINCRPVPAAWILVTPVAKYVIDIAFDGLLIFACYKKNAEVLWISLVYHRFVAVYLLSGFCSTLVLQLDSPRYAFVIREYFLSVMPCVAIVSGLNIGGASKALAWSIWISYVGILSIYLPHLLRMEIQKLDAKGGFLPANPAPEADKQRISHAPLQLGLFKMFIIKEVVVIILVTYVAYLVIGMWKLDVQIGHMILVAVITIPCLMVDAALNIVLYCGYYKRDRVLLRRYRCYSWYSRMMYVVIGISVKYYEFIFLLLHTRDYWVMLLHNFHVFLFLWIVYVVIHLYLEMLVGGELARLANSTRLQHPKVTEVSCSTDDEALSCED